VKFAARAAILPAAVLRALRQRVRLADLPLYILFLLALLSIGSRLYLLWP